MSVFIVKVIDSADVIAQVLDARDPHGTRSKHIEEYLCKEKPHKQLMFVLNKVDLIPTWATVITSSWRYCHQSRLLVSLFIIGHGNESPSATNVAVAVVVVPVLVFGVVIIRFSIP